MMYPPARSYHPSLSLLLAACMLLCCQGCSRPGGEAIKGSCSQETSRPESSGPSWSAEISAELHQLTQELYEDLSSLDYVAWLTSPYEEPIQPSPFYPAFQDLTETGWNQRLEIIKSLKFQLGILDPALLAPDQRDMYDILSFFADKELAMASMKNFRLLHYLSPECGLMVQIPRSLNAIPLNSRQDVEDYLLLLSDLPRLFKDLGELCREEAGVSITFTSQWLQDAASACAPYCLTPEHNSLVSSFSRRLERIEDLTQEEREAYLARNQEAISQKVIPAYQKLSQDIRELPAQSKPYEGLCGQKNGRDYYRLFILRASGTSYSDIHQLKQGIEEQLKQNTLTLDTLLSQLPEDSSEHLPAVTRSPELLLSFLAEETAHYFPFSGTPSIEIETVPADVEDLWKLPCLDYSLQESGSAGLLISQHIAENQELLYDALSSTGFPGKYYRENYLKSNPDMPLLSLLSFPGWEQGWDLYGRSCAISFDNGLLPEEKQLARLSLSSFLAIHALIDIQVNYYGWGLEDVQDFLAEHYSMKEEGIAETLYRSAIYSPGSSVITYAGYLEIRQMKVLAIQQLGDTFDERSFHQFLLEKGPAPFPLIRSWFSDWISR